MAAIRYRNWVKIGGNPDWWTYLRQPARIVDELFAVESIAASLGHVSDRDLAKG